MEFAIALITLTLLEIVLGIDNIIFVSIVSNKLPHEKQGKARVMGLLFALIFRIILLFSIVWVVKHLTAPLFPLDGMSIDEVVRKMHEETSFLQKLSLMLHAVGVREIILALGGLFLLAKSTSEIHHKMEGHTKEVGEKKTASLGSVIFQIILFDIIFSFDSILTAVGLTENLAAMITAVVISLGIMLIFAGKISSFISQHPSLELLALSFLILIGFMLLLEGVHVEVPKGYIYFAVFFSLIVELINMRMRKKHKPVELHKKMK